MFEDENSSYPPEPTQCPVPHNLPFSKFRRRIPNRVHRKHQEWWNRWGNNSFCELEHRERKIGSRMDKCLRDMSWPVIILSLSNSHLALRLGSISEFQSRITKHARNRVSRAQETWFVPYLSLTIDSDSKQPPDRVFQMTHFKDCSTKLRRDSLTRG